MQATTRIVLAIAGLCLLSACGPKGKKDEKKEEASIPVEVASVTAGSIDAAYRGTATLEAEDEATVMAKQGGVIEQVLVEEGDRVRAGEVLARLETDKLRLEALRSKAEVERLDQDFTRLKSVFQRNLVSREAYDKTQYELEGARAAYDLATLALREAEVRSPFEGVITARYIKRGNTIQAGTQAFRVTRLDRLRAFIHVPERDIHKLKAEHRVTLTVDAWPGRAFAGHISLINPVIDPSTGTVKVTVEMDPKQPELKPGMFARAEILYDRHNQAMLVPKDAVLVEDAAESVYVISEGKALRRAIKTGYADARHYEVVTGLKVGEEVVTTGQTSLKDAAKVEIVRPRGAGEAIAEPAPAVAPAPTSSTAAAAAAS